MFNSLFRYSLLFVVSTILLILTNLGGCEKISGSESETPIFTKYSYSGEGDPRTNNILIDIPFDAETHDFNIIWWVKPSNSGDGDSWSNNWSFYVYDNQTGFGQCSDCVEEWKVIIIDYGLSDS